MAGLVHEVVMCVVPDAEVRLTGRSSCVLDPVTGT
jgi:hypothetical protein